MAFMTTPTDVLAISAAARKLDPNPLSLAGKLVGFGSDEQKAGIPIWAWVTVGMGIGAAIGWRLARHFGPEKPRKLQAFE